MAIRYRPWGPLGWMLPRLPGRQWSVLGVLATEDRCAASLSILAKLGVLVRRFLLIRDPAPSSPEAFEQRYVEMAARMHAMGLTADEIVGTELLADIDTIRDHVNAFLEVSTPDIVLDITSMPKWWFFPVLRMLLASDCVRSLVVTYASAVNYAESLATDPAPLGPLPTYNEPAEHERYDELIIGIGFAALSLRELYSAEAAKIRYMFPFPPGPPNFLRNWEFLRVLESEIENRSMSEGDRWYVNMYDCPNVFEALRTFTRDGTRTSALAPFGPKTISLSMCLFALAAARAGRPPVHVFYTQPRRYDINYSSGIRMVDRQPDVKAYCVRLNGSDVYDL